LQLGGCLLPVRPLPSKRREYSSRSTTYYLHGWCLLAKLIDSWSRREGDG
jgi:hypothetical protein